MKHPAHGTAPRRGGDFPKHLAIWAVLALELFPVYMMLQISLKDNARFLENPWLPSAPGAWAWENYGFALRTVLPHIANSIVVCVATTAGTLALALLGAYFFARRRMPFSGLLWAAFLVLLLLPAVVNIVPLFTLLKQMHLLNTLAALVLLGIAGGQVFCIYILRNFIEDIPEELFEAAEMDGASHLRQVAHIVLPASAPVLGTLAVLVFLGQWNDFLMPLVVLRDPELFTVGVGLIYLDGEYVKRWGQIMAAFAVASLPLVTLFLFTMRLFVQGLGRPNFRR